MGARNSGVGKQDGHLMVKLFTTILDSCSSLIYKLGGTNYGAAIAGTNNANTYFHSAVCGFLTWGYNVFYFEAFDEPWKPVSVGDDGSVADETHWGAMTADRATKFPLRC